MSKVASMVVLFLGVFLLVFASEPLHGGCSRDDCKGNTTGRQIACSESTYKQATNSCTPVNLVEGWSLNCDKASGQLLEVNCDECVCVPPRPNPTNGAACVCRHQDTR